MNVDVPRDRKGEFESPLVKKQQTSLSGDIEGILSMYAKGMTNRDIDAYICEIYGIEVSGSTKDIGRGKRMAAEAIEGTLCGSIFRHKPLPRTQ